jgi:hypothetical protein
MAKTRTADDQPSLNGMEDVKNPRVHRAALRYVRERDKRMTMTQEEKAAHNSLLDIMKQEGLTSYKYGDLEVNIDSTEKVKVKKASAEGAAESEE